MIFEDIARQAQSQAQFSKFQKDKKLPNKLFENGKHLPISCLNWRHFINGSY